jgi:hypothetical protein
MDTTRRPPQKIAELEIFSQRSLEKPAALLELQEYCFGQDGEAVFTACRYFKDEDSDLNLLFADEKTLTCVLKTERTVERFSASFSEASIVRNAVGAYPSLELKVIGQIQESLEKHDFSDYNDCAALQTGLTL